MRNPAIVLASYDFVLVAPPQIDQDDYDRITEDVSSVLEDSYIQGALKRMSCLPTFVRGTDYRERLEQVGISLCEKCSCSQDSCKKKCPKCL